jgi:quinol monooxygenase YgiN
MILARFQVQCRPERTEEMAAAIAAVEAPSRALPGVVHFDVARSLTDPDTFVVIEVSGGPSGAGPPERAP